MVWRSDCVFGCQRFGVVRAQHSTLIRELNSETWRPGHISRNAVFLAILSTLVGVGLSAYLLILR
jgi:putative membrane protein